MLAGVALVSSVGRQSLTGKTGVRSLIFNHPPPRRDLGLLETCGMVLIVERHGGRQSYERVDDWLSGMGGISSVLYRI